MTDKPPENREVSAGRSIFVCDIETPWNRSIPTPVRHIHARREGTCDDGCCDRWRCPICGHIWLQELPD